MTARHSAFQCFTLARALIALALACTACDSPTGPYDRLAGAYVLVAVDGGSVPDSLEIPFDGKYELVAETLTVAPNRVARITTYLAVGGTPTAQLPIVATATVVGDSVFITFEEFGMDVAAGVLLSDGIELRYRQWSLFWSDRLLRYRKVEDS